MKIIYFFFIIFLINTVLAEEIKVSPEQINFTGQINKEYCKNIEIYSSSLILIEDRWAEKGFTNRDFIKHKFSSSDLNLEIKYKNKTFQTDSFEVCLKSKNSGVYHGLLLFRENNSNNGVGIWINSEFTSKDTQIVLIPKTLTKKVIQNTQFNSSFLLVILLLLILIIELIIFLGKNVHFSLFPLKPT